LTITYRATSGTTYLKQFQGADYGNYLTLGSLTVDGAWHTTRFVTSPLNMYDATSGGPVNLQFRITNDNVLVDTISVCRDTDGDTISDALEALRISQSSVGTHVHDLNPFSADTDSDGLNDNVETSPAYNTDPCDPDTDSDGLLDGSEKYSYTWSTDDSYLVPDNNTVLDITDQRPGHRRRQRLDSVLLPGPGHHARFAATAGGQDRQGGRNAEGHQGRQHRKRSELLHPPKPVHLPHFIHR